MWNDVNLGINVNLKAMKLFGIEAATYFALITQILPRVAAKNTADENGFFSIDRKYVEEQIGLSCEKQYNCDSILSRNNLVAAAEDSRDRIAVDVKMFLNLVAESDPDKIKETVKRSNLPKTVLERDAANARAVARAEEKRLKAEQAELERIQKEEARRARQQKRLDVIEGQKRLAMAHPICTNETLAALAGNWVNSIYSSNNFLTDDLIPIFLNRLADFNSDPNIRAQLLEIAMSRAYKDATWVISQYCKAKKSGGTITAGTPTKVATPQKISTVDTINQDTLF